MLKDKIENLIKRGCLTEFVQQEGARRARYDVGSHVEHSSCNFEQPGNKRKNVDESRRPLRSPEDGGNVVGVIHTIAGEFSPAGRTSLERKRYVNKPLSVELRPKKSKEEHPSEVITFFDEDLRGIESSHKNALIVLTKIANYQVQRVLIDKRSSTDIMYSKCFNQMGISRQTLKPFKGSLVGFNGEAVEVEGSVELPVTLKDGNLKKTVMLQFCLVKLPSAYNVILGRPFLNAVRAIPSSWHVCLKFLTSG
ncbi:Gag-pol polyprotein [Quillaja saponaria]|uniref:Gag-pol polyprotein n=1 Tax=Quillaja saponaria TaxID=32244 RepID=A0AAD7QJY9_QUISA|nr:Gag-pol polyprotein [Quillaja saponaria]